MRPPVVTFISPLKNLKQVLLLGGNYLFPTERCKKFCKFWGEEAQCAWGWLCHPDICTNLPSLYFSPKFLAFLFASFMIYLFWYNWRSMLCLLSWFFCQFFWLWWMKRSDVVKSSVESFQVVERGSAKNKLLTNWAQINFCRLPPSSPPPLSPKFIFLNLVNWSTWPIMQWCFNLVNQSCSNVPIDCITSINQSINFSDYRF